MQNLQCAFQSTLNLNLMSSVSQGSTSAEVRPVSNETELERVLSPLSVLLSALILLALVNFSFWSDLYQHPSPPPPPSLHSSFLC